MIETIILFVTIICVNKMAITLSDLQLLSLTEWTEFFFDHIRLGLVYCPLALFVFHKKDSHYLHSFVVLRFQRRNDTLYCRAVSGFACAFKISLAINLAYFCFSFRAVFSTDRIIYMTFGNFIMNVFFWNCMYHVYTAGHILLNSSLAAAAVTLGSFDMILFGRLSMRFSLREYIIDIRQFVCLSIQGIEGLNYGVLACTILALVLFLVECRLFSVKDLVYKNERD